MDWKKELGIQIREGRSDKFLKQDELSKLADVHTNMISRYERGESAPELDVLIRLATKLGKQEFQIGDNVVSIRPAGEATEVPSLPRQLRLKYGEEYIFDSRGSSMKIQPSKEGLFITPAQRKASG
jgi:transcriptional regulator with XRE-family HTH domain